jgi:hypothetical protein
VRIAEGVGYLLEEPKPVLAFRILRMLERGGLPCLCITRIGPPEVARRRIGLSSARPIWLSEIPGADHHSAKAIAGLAKRVEEFVDEHQGRGAIVLDGLEYLIQNNGFDATLLFVEHVNEFIMMHRASLLLSVSPKALEGIQLARLERDLEVPDVAAWTAELDRREWSQRLDRGR